MYDELSQWHVLQRHQLRCVHGAVQPLFVTNRVPVVHHRLALQQHLPEFVSPELLHFLCQRRATLHGL